MILLKFALVGIVDVLVLAWVVVLMADRPASAQEGAAPAPCSSASCTCPAAVGSCETSACASCQCKTTGCQAL